MFGCKHKYGKVIEGFQYCEKCGRAIVAPSDCVHKWQEIATSITKTSTDGHVVEAIKYIMRCSKCGEMLERNF